jgi:hypothetical protein
VSAVADHHADAGQRSGIHAHRCRFATALVAKCRHQRAAGRRGDDRAQGGLRPGTRTETLARAQAVGRAATVALRFQRDATGIRLSVVVDGNLNGVLAREIDSGTDGPIQAPVRLEQLFPGVVIGMPAESDDDPVQLGGSEILSFTPAGTATSGTVYLRSRDGSRFAVRVFGVTARVRLLRLDQSSGDWVESF